MATESVAVPRIKSAIEGVEKCGSVDAVMRMLQRHTYETAPSCNHLGKLSSEELVTVSNATNNWKAACLNGLRHLAESMAAHDPTVDEFDKNGASWLLSHLTEELELATEMNFSATSELHRRGYDWMGVPLSSR